MPTPRAGLPWQNKCECRRCRYNRHRQLTFAQYAGQVPNDFKRSQQERVNDAADAMLRYYASLEEYRDPAQCGPDCNHPEPEPRTAPVRVKDFSTRC